jgi:hypothetical protein
MAVLSPYSLATFKAYLHTVLGDVATRLGWTVVGGQYDEVVTDALLILNADDIATLTSNTQLKKLRAAGKLALWQKVAGFLTGDYDFSADGGSYSRSQAHDNALAMIKQAENEASALGVLEGYEVTSLAAKYTRDPYRDYTDDLATTYDQLEALN